MVVVIVENHNKHNKTLADTEKGQLYKAEI